jgi:hypothetical protein
MISHAREKRQEKRIVSASPGSEAYHSPLHSWRNAGETAPLRKFRSIWWSFVRQPYRIVQDHVQQALGFWGLALA